MTERTVLWDHEIAVGDTLVAVVLWMTDTPDDWDVCVEVHNPDGEIIDTFVWAQGFGDAWSVDQRRPPVPRMTRAQRSEYLAAIRQAKARGEVLWPTFEDPPDNTTGESNGSV